MGDQMLFYYVTSGCRLVVAGVCFVLGVLWHWFAERTNVRTIVAGESTKPGLLPLVPYSSHSTPPPSPPYSSLFLVPPSHHNRFMSSSRGELHLCGTGLSFYETICHTRVRLPVCQQNVGNAVTPACLKALHLRLQHLHIATTSCNFHGVF